MNRSSAVGKSSEPPREKTHDLSDTTTLKQQRSSSHRTKPAFHQPSDTRRRYSNGASGNARWTQGLRRASSTSIRSKETKSNKNRSSGSETSQDRKGHPAAKNLSKQECSTTELGPALQNKLELCVEDIARYRQASQIIEAKIRARKAVQIWRSATFAARFQGPFEVPQHNSATVGSFATLQETAEGAVTAFLLACLRRCQDRKSGNDLVMLTMHPRLLQIDRDGGGSSIRKHVLKQLHTLKKEAVASYVCGTTLENNLRVNPRAVVFEFDRCAQKGGRSVCSDGATSKVYVVTSIALPPSRGVQVTRYGGRWMVSDFRELCISVPSMETPVVETDDLPPLASTPRGSADAHTGGHTNSTLEDRGYVPGMIRVFDCHGFVTGYVPAINFARARRQRLLKLGESEDARAQRHERARSNTSALAQKLTTNEILNRWETMPQIPRRLVGGNGMIQTVPPLTLAHVSKLRESGRAVQPGAIKPRVNGASRVSLPAIQA
eukprot:m.738952 g.738952  ORF g.738952 m.738952 type:complete len:494 (-) comp23101_c0_seq12:1225-2706(-)